MNLIYFFCYTASLSVQIRLPVPCKSSATAALVKLKESKITSRPVAEQIQLITLGATAENDDGAAFIQVLQQYTRHTFGPLVRTSDTTSQVFSLDLLLFYYYALLFIDGGNEREQKFDFSPAKD